jgi:hypothetical protein
LGFESATPASVPPLVTERAPASSLDPLPPPARPSRGTVKLHALEARDPAASRASAREVQFEAIVFTGTALNT